jgi:AmmeMemoRadiSam system protein B
MSSASIRRPAVAGQFYDGSPEGLRREIEACFRHRLGPVSLPQVNATGPRSLLGLVSPHAGYAFSGPPAAKGYHALAADGQPECVVVIGPSHRRAGHAAVLQTSGAWQTPLGATPVHAEVAALIAGTSDFVRDEPSLLEGEHSLEVQLPFLQYIYGAEFGFVPVMMLEQSAESAELLGAALAHALGGRDAVIIASTDMTHYETPQVAKRQDDVLIARILALDPEGLCREALRAGMSMCGFGPTAAMLFAAKALGATRADVLAYSTSGDMQRMTDVVAYLSASVSR